MNENHGLKRFWINIYMYKRHKQNYFTTKRIPITINPNEFGFVLTTFIYG